MLVDIDHFDLHRLLHLLNWHISVDEIFHIGRNKKKIIVYSWHDGQGIKPPKLLKYTSMINIHIYGQLGHTYNTYVVFLGVEHVYYICSGYTCITP